MAIECSSGGYGMMESPLVSLLSKPGWIFEGYSDFWRRNKSISEAAELANVLRALRKVAGHIGTNVGSVEWAGMTEVDQSKGIIRVDPTLALQDYPVPPGKMDIFVGIVAHEAYHHKEWSELVWTNIESVTSEMSFKDKDLLYKMVTAGEDIYVNKLADKMIFGLYIHKVRDILRGQIDKSLSAPPTAGMLFDIWCRKVLDNQEWNNLNQLYLEPLNILLAHTPDLINIGDEKASVTERCNKRSEFYLKLWDKISNFILPWKRDQITYFGTRRTDFKEKEAKKSKRKRAKTPDKEPAMSLKLASEIEESLAIGSTDITPLIKSICGEDDQDVIPTSLWDFTIPSHPSIDPYLVSRLKGAFYTYAQRVVVANRGLESGSIDKRRLYRAPIDKRCFMIKQFIPELAWNISILVDASRSMHGSKWQLIESTCASLYKALEGHKNKVQVYGYFEHNGVCIVSRLLKNGKLYSIPPHGRTPSGQAILAAALQKPKEGKRKFILHITDGESNCGCEVKHALEYCKKQKIELVTLGCSYKNQDILLQQYGKHVQFLDYFEQLPKAIENLLRRKLLYSTKG